MTAPGSTSPTSGCPDYPLAFGYVQPPDGRVHAGRGVGDDREDRRRAGLPAWRSAASSRRDRARHPAPSPSVRCCLIAPDGRTSRFSRAAARFDAADGRAGTGWIEWNQPDPDRPGKVAFRSALALDPVDGSRPTTGSFIGFGPGSRRPTPWGSSTTAPYAPYLEEARASLLRQGGHPYTEVRETEASIFPVLELFVQLSPPAAISRSTVDDPRRCRPFHPRHVPGWVSADGRWPGPRHRGNRPWRHRLDGKGGADARRGWSGRSDGPGADVALVRSLRNRHSGTRSLCWSRCGFDRVFRPSRRGRRLHQNTRGERPWPSPSATGFPMSG